MQNGQRRESSQDPAEKDTTTHRRRKEIFPAAMRIAPTVEPRAHRRPRITTPIPWHHRQYSSRELVEGMEAALSLAASQAAINSKAAGNACANHPARPRSRRSPGMSQSAQQTSCNGDAWYGYRGGSALPACASDACCVHDRGPAGQ